jgi:hypothetical protein
MRPKTHQMFVSTPKQIEEVSMNEELPPARPAFSGLMLHCGGQLKTRQEVFGVPLPEATKSYVPLAYESFLTRIEKQVKTEGMEIQDQKLALSHNGQRLFGLLHLKMPGIVAEDYGCVLGLRNSYDKSCSTGLCVGATVFVCDNLSFSGSQITFERKHTANLLRDLSWIITETISKLPVLFANQSKTFEVYRERPLSDKEAHDLIVRLYDEGAINVTQIPGLLKEWRTPRHAEFEKGGKTMWRLFNATTETVKGDLWRLPYRTGIVHRVLDAECGLDSVAAK